MEGLVVILDGINEPANLDIRIQFFLDFSYKGLLGRFARLNLSARELPLPLELAIAPGRGKDLIAIANNCCN